jgi:hypothetical protein
LNKLRHGTPASFLPGMQKWRAALSDLPAIEVKRNGINYLPVASPFLIHAASWCGRSPS